MLIAYDANGEVVATLDHVVARNEEGHVIGLVDFAAQEEAGELLDIWRVPDAVGSGTWPEWLGSRAYDFKIERANGRISALIHKTSGARRDRATIEKAIAKRMKEAGDKPADLRDLVGGPGKPLELDEKGRTLKREPVQRTKLPVIGRANAG